MPVWLTVGFITWILTEIVKYVGIIFITYQGADLVVSQAGSFIQSKLSGMGSEYAGLAGLACVDKGVTIILSGFAVRFAWQFLPRPGVKSSSAA